MTDCTLLVIGAVLARGAAGATMGELVDLLRRLEPPGVKYIWLRQYPINAFRSRYLQVVIDERGRKRFVPGTVSLDKAALDKAAMLVQAFDGEALLRPAAPTAAPPEEPQPEIDPAPFRRRWISVDAAPRPAPPFHLRSVFECVLQVPLRDPCGVHGERAGAGAPKS